MPLSAWLVAAFSSALASSLWSLSVKSDAQAVPALEYALSYSALAAAMVAVVVGATYGFAGLALQPRAVVAGLFHAAAVVAITRSIQLAPNPGLSMAVFSSQALLTALGAAVWFGSSLSTGGVVAMLMVVLGVYLVQVPDTESATPDTYTNNTDTETDNTETETGTPTSAWLWYGAASAVAISGKDLFTKWATNALSATIEGMLWSELAFQSLALVLYGWYESGRLLPRYLVADGDAEDEAGRWGGTLLTAAAFVAYTLTVLLATKLAPNVGYAKSITALGVLLTTAVSYVAWGMKIRPRAVAGIVIIVLGVSGIATL